MPRHLSIEFLRFTPIKKATPRPNSAGQDTGGGAWRAWCEAWAVYHRLDTPDKRRCYLRAVQTARGDASRRALEALIMAIHRGATTPVSNV